MGAPTVKHSEFNRTQDIAAFQEASKTINKVEEAEKAAKNQDNTPVDKNPAIGVVDVFEKSRVDIIPNSIYFGTTTSKTDLKFDPSSGNTSNFNQDNEKHLGIVEEKSTLSHTKGKQGQDIYERDVFSVKDGPRPVEYIEKTRVTVFPQESNPNVPDTMVDTFIQFNPNNQF